ncbi:septum formation family protein [Nocardioides sp.]|uniref:septum formation family protein n=1 Tax=Nocardioides sp. TaxID=35761 RepID=UPI0037834706
MRRPAATVVAVVVAAVLGPVLAGCSGGSDEPSAGATSTSPSTTTPSPSAPPTATVPRPPRERACYDLTYAEAIAPTTSARHVSCKDTHTAATYAVGTVDDLVDGHLLAVDSDRVQAEVAKTCPEKFARVVGGTEEDRRLSMLRPVWFTPTVEESDAGADWYRCDAVAIAADEELAPLTTAVQGALDSEEGRDRYGMCGTAQPGTAHFERVICTADHSWRAVAVVPFVGGSYPGVAKVKAAGQTPCQDAGAAAASDSLDYQWGYEWPTAEQWATGQTFGRCWAPD